MNQKLQKFKSPRIGISNSVKKVLSTLFPIKDVERPLGKECHSVLISKSPVYTRALRAPRDLKPGESIVMIRGFCAFHHEIQPDHRSQRYLFTYGPVYLDARAMSKNPGKFVRRSCIPNSYLRCGRTDSEFYLIIVAKEFIRNGVEITIDFNADVFPLCSPLECIMHSMDRGNCRKNGGYIGPPKHFVC